MRLTLIAVHALAVTACGASNLLPDGGRAQLGCSGTSVTVPVKVLGLVGQPVSGASVTATWLAYDSLTQTLITDDRGVATVQAQLGPGVVRVAARSNSLSSRPADITFTGGACVDAATPRDVLLTLEAQ